MRIFVAGIATEVNTFSPIFIGMDAFRGLGKARNGGPALAPLGNRIAALAGNPAVLCGLLACLGQRN